MADDLKNYLKDAIRIEISTIPLYLFAMYSIKQDEPGAEARETILTVVKQEMLHLALAGNLMAATDDGGGPILYNKDYFPTYGGLNDTILKTKIPLILDRCEKSSLETFTKIEAPWPLTQSLVGIGIASEENSIGEFYQQLEKEIDKLPSPGGFNKNGNKQFPDSENPDGTDVVFTITDKVRAKKALEIIIHQGEGGGDPINGHYQKFIQLSKDWEQRKWSCWNIKRSPSRKDYKGKPLIENLNDAFNAAYCYLLLAISKVWHTEQRNKLIETYRYIMVNVLSPLADLLVSLPLSTGPDAEYAAPTFEKYPKAAPTFEKHPKADADTTDITAAMKTHINEAKKSQDLTGEQKKLLDAVLFSIGRTSWPSQ